MNFKKTSLSLSCFLTMLTLAINALANETASLKTTPDSSLPGPHPVASSEYRLPAEIDSDVLPDRMTEIWAKVFYPKDIANTQSKAPLVVMLHGNHATCGFGSNPRSDTSCTYTSKGICPDGYVVVPNHEGYNYLGENLASWGFWVVSINANRGITCGGGSEGDWGLNLARGKLVLKHLGLLYKWASTGGAPASLGLGPDGLLGKIDFANVGLFGHSRGGEGVRAAYNLYLDSGSPWPAKIPGLSIKAIFEIGAVDGQTSRVLDANGTVWNQLLPMCDGDVIDLEGRYPFERMLLNTSESVNAQKSLYEVWGANHNYFNTEWQTSDSNGCVAGTLLFDPNGSGSELQQKIALASVPAFFRSHLGSNPEEPFNQNFNPLDFLPSTVTNITQVDRDFTPTPASGETEVFEDFDQETGINTSGNQNVMGQINLKHKNLISETVQRVADLSWDGKGQATFFEAVWAGPSLGKDINGYATLDFRIARKLSSPLNPDPITDFGIQFEDANGHFSNEVPVSNFVAINGPGNDNPVLKTVRIPLSVFSGIDTAKVHGVRFNFNKTNTGAIYLANIRLNHQIGLGGVEKMLLAKTSLYQNVKAMEIRKPIPPVYVPAHLNSVRVIRTVKKSLLASGKPAVEIVLASQVPFPAMNRLPVLKIGSKEFRLSHYSDPNELKELTFTIIEDEYKTLSNTSEVTVSDGKIWQFGSLAKAMK
jgi:hypothetical protein